MILDKFLDVKEFVITIQWELDARVVFIEDLSMYIEKLEEIGGAEITNIEMRDKEV